MKKHVELDAQGQPFGPMKAVLCSDIKKYAEDLDPTTGWEGQPRHERKRLFRHLYTGKHSHYYHVRRFSDVQVGLHLEIPRQGGRMCHRHRCFVFIPASKWTCADTGRRRHRRLQGRGCVQILFPSLSMRARQYDCHRMLVCWHELEKCCECWLEMMLTMLSEFERIHAGGWCADWTMHGQSDKVCEKWMRPIISKVLINTRWRLNSLIDNNGSKPPDVDPEHWKILVAMRATEAAQVRSEHMRGISKGKGSTTAQMKAIEREVMSRLVSLLPWYVDTDVVVDIISVSSCQHMSRMTSFIICAVCHNVYIGGRAS